MRLEGTDDHRFSIAQNKSSGVVRVSDIIL
jgi:hypothetical protein